MNVSHPRITLYRFKNALYLLDLSATAMMSAAGASEEEEVVELLKKAMTLQKPPAVNFPLSCCTVFCTRDNGTLISDKQLSRMDALCAAAILSLSGRTVVAYNGYGGEDVSVERIVATKEEQEQLTVFSENTYLWHVPGLQRTTVKMRPLGLDWTWAEGCWTPRGIWEDIQQAVYSNQGEIELILPFRDWFCTYTYNNEDIPSRTAIACAFAWSALKDSIIVFPSNVEDSEPRELNAYRSVGEGFKSVSGDNIWDLFKEAGIGKLSELRDASLRNDIAFQLARNLKGLQ